MCFALNHCCHYCGGRVELNPLTLIVKAGMFELITADSRPLQQMKCVNMYIPGYGKKTTYCFSSNVSSKNIKLHYYSKNII